MFTATIFYSKWFIFSEMYAVLCLNFKKTSYWSLCIIKNPNLLRSFFKSLLIISKNMNNNMFNIPESNDVT